MKNVINGLFCTFLFTNVLWYIIFWGSYSSMGNIFIIQKRAIRIMLGLGRRSSCRGGFKQFDKLTVLSLYIYALMLFAVKNLNIYQTISFVHGTNARQQNKVHITSVRFSSIQIDVYYSSIKIFNQLPQNTFKYCNNIHTFKALLRDCIVKNALYSNEEYFLLVIRK